MERYSIGLNTINIGETQFEGVIDVSSVEIANPVFAPGRTLRRNGLINGANQNTLKAKGTHQDNITHAHTIRGSCEHCRVYQSSRTKLSCFNVVIKLESATFKVWVLPHIIQTHHGCLVSENATVNFTGHGVKFDIIN